MSDLRPKQLGSGVRLFLIDLMGINLALGAVFFIYPSMVIDLWPWAVQELAVRFLGAIFIAISLGCFSALREKFWQRGKILVLVGAAFFFVTFLVTLSSTFPQGSPTYAAWAWTLYSLAACSGLFTIVRLYGWSARPQDALSRVAPWRLARGFLRVQTFVVGVFGSLMLFLPDFAQEQFWPWKVAVPTLQTFAALFLATCLATGWGSQQMDRKRIRALLPLDAIFPTLALLAVGIHWKVIMEQSPSGLVTGVWVFLYSFVATGSTYLFFTSRRL